jgi:hypothetical protein
METEERNETKGTDYYRSKKKSVPLANANLNMAQIKMNKGINSSQSKIGSTKGMTHESESMITDVRNEKWRSQKSWNMHPSTADSNRNKRRMLHHVIGGQNMPKNSSMVKSMQNKQ